MPAVLAVVKVLGVLDAPAVVAGDAIPAVEFDVRAVRVVGIQDAADQEEGVTDPPRFQGPADRLGRLAEADAGVADVGMWNRVVPRRRAGIEAFDPQRGITVQFPEPVDVQVDREGSEVSAFQHDRLGGHDQLGTGRTQGHVRELVDQLIEFRQQLPGLGGRGHHAPLQLCGPL